MRKILKWALGVPVGVVLVLYAIGLALGPVAADPAQDTSAAESLVRSALPTGAEVVFRDSHASQRTASRCGMVVHRVGYASPVIERWVVMGSVVMLERASDPRAFRMALEQC